MAGAKQAKAPQWPADQVSRRPIAELVPYARNARTHSPEQVSQLASSIREWGWTMPVLVDEQGTIIAGHGRVMAAQKLGLDEVPVMVARGWSEAKRRAYTIADNKLALNSDWDLETLQLELHDLSNEGIDLALVGFSGKELAEFFESKEDDPPADDEGNYTEQYGVIVVCENEADQQQKYEMLLSMGYNCKVVVT